MRVQDTTVGMLIFNRVRLETQRLPWYGTVPDPNPYPVNICIYIRSGKSVYHSERWSLCHGKVAQP